MNMRKRSNVPTLLLMLVLWAKSVMVGLLPTARDLGVDLWQAFTADATDV